MSVNIYISEALRKESGFSEKPFSHEGGGIKFGGATLLNDKGRLYAILGENEIVPKSLEKFVTDVSLYDFMPCDRTRRELGVYSTEDAEAEVELQNISGGRQQYIIKIKAKSLKSAWILDRKIKTGSMRPTESYEGAQQGMSRAELEATLSELVLQLEQSHAAYDLTERRHAQTDNDLSLAKARVKAAYKLATDLDTQKWPWCLKSTVSTAITCALNGAGN